MAERDEVRAVLVKPGEVLLIGGWTGTFDEASEQAFASFADLTGIKVAVFPEDITIGVAPAEQVPSA